MVRRPGSVAALITIALVATATVACTATGRSAARDSGIDQAASGESGARGADSGSRDTSARGTVRVVGAAPSMAVVLDARGAQLTLTGPLAAELATLHGADVAIHGSLGESSGSMGGGNRSVAVESYTIESIAGEKPVVGTLRAETSGLWLDSTLLGAAPRELEQLIGAKVWVVGTRSANGALDVSTYGVLRRKE